MTFRKRPVEIEAWPVDDTSPAFADTYEQVGTE